MPAVTVIMPFHRVTPFLQPAVLSILGQTLQDLELILVDNGTGAGPAVLKEIGDPRLRLISFADNCGSAAAHNAAREQARGDFIAIMDSDDIALPARLESQLAVLRLERRLGLLFTHALIIDERGRVQGPQFTLASEREQHAFSNYSMPASNPTLMGRKNVFDQFPLREELSAAPDYDFVARVIEVYPCRALPQVLLHYRHHAGQVTTSRQPAMILNACIIRLITARRRAGRREEFREALDLVRPWLDRPPHPAATYRFFAERALAEGFPFLAVYLARRWVSADRTASTLPAASDMLVRAMVQAPRQSIQLVRMFGTGPLCTHGLRPL